jgi:hypothetical protein
MTPPPQRGRTVSSSRSWPSLNKDTYSQKEMRSHLKKATALRIVASEGARSTSLKRSKKAWLDEDGIEYAADFVFDLVKTHRKADFRSEYKEGEKIEKTELRVWL